MITSQTTNAKSAMNKHTFSNHQKHKLITLSTTSATNQGTFSNQRRHKLKDTSSKSVNNYRYTKI